MPIDWSLVGILIILFVIFFGISWGYFTARMTCNSINHDSMIYTYRKRQRCNHLRVKLICAECGKEIKYEEEE